MQFIAVKSLNKILQDEVSFFKFVIGNAILEDVFLGHDLLKLSSGIADASPEGLLGLSTSTYKSLLQAFNRGRQDCHEVRVWEGVMEFDGALHINVQ